MSSVKLYTDTAEAIKAAFEEGYTSYNTACVSMTTFEYEWETSKAKLAYDQFVLLSKMFG